MIVVLEEGKLRDCGTLKTLIELAAYKDMF